jgi:multidrug efflux pump
MESLLRTLLHHSRATLLAFFLILLGGITAYLVIPKEADPDITIPVMYVSMTLEGISPEDGERLLVQPMEQELRTLEGVKRMSATASEGSAFVQLEFNAGFNPRQALQDVREKVANARPKLPREADEPQVHEINVSRFPVLSVALSGPLPEQELVLTARRLKEALRGIPEVLDVNIGGDREDLLEIIVDPQVLDSYGLDVAALGELVTRNNRLVAAGSLDTGAGRMSMKVPGVIDNLQDVLGMPLKVQDGHAINFGDVAVLQRSFKDPTGFARINGQPAVVLEISKRSNTNIIATTQKVKALLAQAQPQMPHGLHVDYILDQSRDVEDMLGDLLNNVLAAVLLVLILVVATMGLRPALMVGLTIPGAFLAGLLMIWAVGYTLNIIVLFALILVSGMLVDGGIVVSELADRYLAEGMTPREAWIRAASRMSWPVISSIITTVMVFVPMLFWPGTVGDFMKYLPATVILCLLSSLVMALVFLPVIGALGKRQRPGAEVTPGWAARHFRRILASALQWPGRAMAGTLLLIVLIYVAYAHFNHGVEFFPQTEPESAQLEVRARGDLSIHEKDLLLQEVEARLLHMPEVRALYARSVASADSTTPDVIGTLQFQFIRWNQRRPASQILDDMRQRTADLPGLVMQFRKQESGPSSGKPVEMQISARDPLEAAAAADVITAQMQKLGGFTAIEDDRSLPGTEWRLSVDRERAATQGADMQSVGNVVQLVTHGLLLATYRPGDATDEVDIRVRLPQSWRSLDQVGRLTLHTSSGQVPLANFVSMQAAPKVDVLHRVNGQRAITLKADIGSGHQLDERLAALRQTFKTLPPGVQIHFAGEDADQREAAQFLASAFVAALLLMSLVLIIQFNSLSQTMLVLSSIVFSTAGVLLGLMLLQQPLGIVMVGMGTIALAGVIVHNNIVLIDTYNELRHKGMSARDAALETGCLRLRPVTLTAVATVVGLIPMVLGININLLEPSLGIGAPSAQLWTQLSTAIAGGLSFATPLTLVLTPCMLVLGARFNEWRKTRKPEK